MSQDDVILGIVEQHAEEAAFLWSQRDRAVRARNRTLKDVAGLDERVEAHLDGLRIAGPSGWKICKQTVDAGEAGAVFALAVLGFESNDPERIREVLTLGCPKPFLERELISALGWLPFERAKPILSVFVKDPDPKVRRTGIAGFAVHRQDPGPALPEAMCDPDNRLRARAIVAAAELGRRDLASYIRPPRAQPDEDSQFAAAWALTRLGWPDEALKAFAEGDGKYAARALDMAMRSMELRAAKVWCSALLNQKDKIRLGVIGAGIIGDPAAVEDLIPLMRDERLARIACDAFSLITGVDLLQEGLAGSAPPEFTERPPEGAGSDEDVSVDLDDRLPWPSADRIETWWKRRGREFSPGLRHLQGKVITIELLQHALSSETERFRAAAALELAIREPHHPVFEIRQRRSRR